MTGSEKLAALPKIKINPRTGAVDPVQTAYNAIEWFLYIVAAIAFAYLIYGGLRFILSGGDEKKVTDARNTILYAIIGIIVVVIAYGVLRWLAGSGEKEILG